MGSRLEVHSQHCCVTLDKFISLSEPQVRKSSVIWVNNMYFAELLCGASKIINGFSPLNGSAGADPLLEIVVEKLIFPMGQFLCHYQVIHKVQREGPI